MRILIIINILILFIFYVKCLDTEDTSTVITTTTTKHPCNNKGTYMKTTNDCLCVSGYETYPRDSKIKCNYELRSYYVAKFCSLIGGVVGADMFYLGYTMKGIFKCIFPIFVLYFILKMQNNKFLRQYQSMSYYLVLLPVVIGFVFYVLDVCLIISGTMKDANGFSLNYD
jgi:hypothetical protein